MFSDGLAKVQQLEQRANMHVHTRLICEEARSARIIAVSGLGTVQGRQIIKGGTP